jgi:hypothetical protein
LREDKLRKPQRCESVSPTIGKWDLIFGQYLGGKMLGKPIEGADIYALTRTFTAALIICLETLFSHVGGFEARRGAKKINKTDLHHKLFE